MALVDLNRMMKSEALQGIGQSEQLEQQREQANKQIKSQEKAETMGAVGTGAAIGTMVLPGWGTAIGAGIGLLADALL